MLEAIPFSRCFSGYNDSERRLGTAVESGTIKPINSTAAKPSKTFRASSHTGTLFPVETALPPLSGSNCYQTYTLVPLGMLS